MNSANIIGLQMLLTIINVIVMMTNLQNGRAGMACFNASVAGFCFAVALMRMVR
jgi:hypothetical protein